MDRLLVETYAAELASEAAVEHRILIANGDYRIEQKELESGAVRITVLIERENGPPIIKERTIKPLFG